MRVKLENEAHAAESAARPQKDAYTRAREARREQLLREPTGKKLPRATFRRGCRAHWSGLGLGLGFGLGFRLGFGFGFRLGSP